jgi:hypothetical protein
MAEMPALAALSKPWRQTTSPCRSRPIAVVRRWGPFYEHGTGLPVLLDPKGAAGAPRRAHGIPNGLMSWEAGAMPASRVRRTGRRRGESGA